MIKLKSHFSPISQPKEEYCPLDIEALNPNNSPSPPPILLLFPSPAIMVHSFALLQALIQDGDKGFAGKIKRPRGRWPLKEKIFLQRLRRKMLTKNGMGKTWGNHLFSFVTFLRDGKEAHPLNLI